ncbi:MAG TPA: DUF4142 domain-containing protein, partial [Segetibacter sp.]
MKKASCYLSPSLAVALMVGMCAKTEAQSTNRTRNTSSTATTATGSIALSDTAFIGKSIRDNLMELQMLQMGKNKATGSQLTKATQQMITDHTQMLADLQRVGRTKGMTGPMMNGGGMNAGSMSGLGMTGSGTTGMTGTAGSTTGTGTSGSTMGTT